MSRLHEAELDRRLCLLALGEQPRACLELGRDRVGLAHARRSLAGA